jgi:hypothetical protein
LPAAGLPATVAGLIVARPTAATIAIPTATAGGGRTVVPGFAADAARIHAVVAIIRAVVAVISARRLGAGIGDGYRAAGTGQHQRTGDRKRRQTTSDQAIAPHHIGALRFKRPQAIPRAIWNETSPSYTQLRCSTPPFLVKQPSFGHNVAMGLGRSRRRQHSGKDHHSDRKLELVGHPVPGVRRRRMAIVIDSPAGLARSSLPCVGGPFRCYRNKNLTKRANC